MTTKEKPLVICQAADQINTHCRSCPHAVTHRAGPECHKSDACGRGRLRLGECIPMADDERDVRCSHG